MINLSYISQKSRKNFEKIQKKFRKNLEKISKKYRKNIKNKYNICSVKKNKICLYRVIRFLYNDLYRESLKKDKSL